jgi:hypothetical protein
MRDDLPAHVIHEVGCPDAPKNLIVFRVANVATAYPSARAHTCISHQTVAMNREVVAEFDNGTRGDKAGPGRLP